MLSDQELKALLEAASKGPWYRGYRGTGHDIWAKPPDVDWPDATVVFISAPQTKEEDADLAVLAPDLAQQVLDLRDAGAGLANFVAELQGHISTFDEPPGVYLHDLLSRADKARDRWADLHEEGKRDA